MPWRWDPQAQRYRNVNGSAYFISRAQVMEWVNTSLSQTGLVADHLANMVANDFLAPADWHAAMREEIKREYIRQYLTARGGVNTMTPQDWGSVGGMLKEQYGWLQGFFEEISTGDLTEAQIRVRSRMYINSGREAFERAKDRVAVEWGADEVYWGTDPAAENCVDCQAFELMGWRLLADDPYDGAYPGSGDTICLTNCKCGLSYRNSTTGEEYYL